MQRTFPGFVLSLACVAMTACGEANTNDFAPSDNVLRRGSEGADDEHLRALRQAGRPASIEAAQAAPKGLLIRIENALRWPQGARGVDTRVHLNARICGERTDQAKKKKSGDNVEMVHCHPLAGTVNQGEHEYFYLTAGEAFAVIKDSENGYQATLQYKLTSQTDATWHSGGRIALNSALDKSKQTVEVQVIEARPSSYYDVVSSNLAP